MCVDIEHLVHASTRKTVVAPGTQPRSRARGASRTTLCGTGPWRRFSWAGCRQPCRSPLAADIAAPADGVHVTLVVSSYFLHTPRQHRRRKWWAHGSLSTSSNHDPNQSFVPQHSKKRKARVDAPHKIPNSTQASLYPRLNHSYPLAEPVYNISTLSSHLRTLATARISSHEHARVGGDSSHDRVLVGCDRQGSTVAPDLDHLGQASPHAEVEERLPRCAPGWCCQAIEEQSGRMIDVE